MSPITDSRPHVVPATWAARAWASARGAPTPASASAEAAWSTSPRTRAVGLMRSRLLQPRLLVGGGQCIEKGIQVTVEDLVEVVRLEVDPVVGDAVLREVIRPDSLAAVDGADLAGPVGRRVGLCLVFGQGLQPRSQHLHGADLVLQLAAFVLTGHDDAGG